MPTRPAKAAPPLYFLDGLRGLSALYVVIGHARWLLWEGYQGYKSHPDQYSIFNKIILYSLTVFRFGHEAVLMFFVLSGFLIHFGYAGKINRSITSFDWSSYMVRRVKRIFPPLLASLFLTFILDRTGQYMGLSIYNQQTQNAQINQNISINLDGLTLLGNTAFLQTVYVPVWGSNGPLWSLMYEWWFYLLYPLFYLINRFNIWASLLTVIGCTSLCWLSLLPPSFKLITMVGSYWICWVSGAFIADVYHKRVSIPIRNLVWLCVVAPVYVLSSKYLDNNAIIDTFLSIFLSGVLAGLLWLNTQEPRYLKWIEKMRWLGSCSYTLYVTHFSILVFTSGFLLSKNENNLPKSFEYTLMGIITVVLIAYFIHFLVEVPFSKKSTPRAD